MEVLNVLLDPKFDEDHNKAMRQMSRDELAELRSELKVSKRLTAEFSDAAEVSPKELTELRRDRKLLEWFASNFFCGDLDYHYDSDTSEYILTVIRGDGTHEYRGKTPLETISTAMEAER